MTVNSVLSCDNNVAVANKMVLPKSSSLKYTGCEDSQVSIPNRKRRLDQLTLEEKLHRKKLKNRVVAQSPRDREEARLDDLEAEVKALREKNEALTLQCHNLNLEKTQLATENQQLLHKLSNILYNHQTHVVSCSTQVDPAKFSIDPLLQRQTLQLAVGLGPQVDSPEVLHSLPDLLDSLDIDVCLSHLDELAQSLLRKAAEEKDTEHRQASAEVGTYGFQGKRSCNKVVGSSPEDVETNRELITCNGSLKFT
jgi:DNA repair exonuclease SbcCD ATPase subunit